MMCAKIWKHFLIDKVVSSNYMNKLVQNLVIKANLLLFNNFIFGHQHLHYVNMTQKNVQAPIDMESDVLKKKSDSLLKKPIC